MNNIDASIEILEHTADLVEPFQDGSSELANVDPHGKVAEQAARQEAERALHFLRNFSATHAILLTKDWQVLHEPFAFEFINVYQEVATEAGCHLVTIDFDSAGGVEHLLFLVKEGGLGREDYLALASKYREGQMWHANQFQPLAQ